MRIIYTLIFTAITGLLIYAGINWLGGGNPGPSLIFNGPEEVFIGMPFDLEVGVSNQSGRILRDAVISLVLPSGVVFVGQSAGENLSSKKMGDLGTGSLTGETFKLMAVSGAAEDVREIKVGIGYLSDPAGSRFEKEERWRMSIAGPAIKLTLSAPDRVAGGAAIQLKVNYENISGEEMDDLFLEIEYPRAFQYEKAAAIPDRGNNYWRLGGLRPGSASELLIFGRLIGLENSVHDFKARLGLELDGETYVVDEQVTNVAVKIAPLSLKILANNVSEYIAVPGDLIEYSINYQYLDQPTAGAAITAELIGAMFEKNETLTWRVADSGQSGSVKFSARVRNDYPIRRLGDRNFVLRVEARIDDGRNVTVAELENKVVGRFDLAARGFFRDAASGVLNQGTFPPRVGQPTEYTVHWILTNYSNDIRDVTVQAKLPDYVKLTDVIKSNGGSRPVYDKNTGEVTWKIDRATATRGIIGEPLEAVFQISAAPPPDAIGRYLTLLEETMVSAIDEFTSFPLTGSAPAIDTRLPDDKTIGEDEGRVAS